MADLTTSLGLNDTTNPPNINTSIDAFQQQNMSPSDIYSLGGSIPQTIGGIPGIGSRIPSLAKIPIPFVTELNNALTPLNNAKFGVAGEFDTVHYADDLNKHHPKFKFLFKVGFYGFPGGDDFYFYVHRCDKPKVKFNHQDVNYYNFRTRVLTSVTYDPLTIQFLDEIGNSVTNFFQAYLQQTSGTGAGNYGIDNGWGSASSSKEYANGYTFAPGQRIVLEQVFIDPNKNGGPRSNRFTFLNPRIETFDFDELTHEESSTGSMANLSFTYDAIHVDTVNETTIHSWGNTDLFKAGGTSGVYNAGNTDGNPMYTGGGPPVKKPQLSLYDQLRKGSDIITHIPNALAGIISSGVAPAVTALNSATNSAGDLVSSGISGTLTSIKSGANMVFGGKTEPYTGGTTYDAAGKVTSYNSNGIKTEIS